MRAIERSSAFKRDYKRESKGPHRPTLDTDLVLVLKALANDQPALFDELRRFYGVDPLAW